MEIPAHYQYKQTVVDQRQIRRKRAGERVKLQAVK
jgi:hypothetical protein